MINPRKKGNNKKYMQAFLRQNNSIWKYNSIANKIMLNNKKKRGKEAPRKFDKVPHERNFSPASTTHRWMNEVGVTSSPLRSECKWRNFTQICAFKPFIFCSIIRYEGFKEGEGEQINASVRRVSVTSPVMLHGCEKISKSRIKSCNEISGIWFS